MTPALLQRWLIFGLIAGLAIVSMVRAGNHGNHQHQHGIAADSLREKFPLEDGVHRLTFADLKTAPYAAGQLPADLAALAGQQVALVGYVEPLEEGPWVRHFYLREFSFGCCPGAPPVPWHLVEVRLPEGMPPVPVKGVPVQVTGTFQVEEVVGPDGTLVSVYALQPQQVLVLEDQKP